jgi:hypothetical protein
MKMIVITEKGQIQSFAHGSKADHTPLSALQKHDKPHAGVRGGLLALPGQEMHEVDVPDELAKLEDGQQIHDGLRELMKKQ